VTPERIGNYRLDSLLGSGGMGEVYKAYDMQRDRYVALKLLPAAFSGDEEYLSRFQRESHVVARLTDPHIIPIHDFGEIDGRLFIDMRLVDGTDIGTLLHAHGPIAPQRAAYMVSQIAEALDAAHADHIVHRDIKPSNLLVTKSDFVYVIDFGITRAAGLRQTALTVTGATVGTLSYMAPERFKGQDIDGRSDVYSLACVLHECLTGAPPFGDQEVPALIYSHLHSSCPPASSLVEGIPPGLDDVIARGMAKDPGDRFQTAGQLSAAVREALLPGASPRGTEPRDEGWGVIPASAWTSATEAGQSTGQPPEPEEKAATAPGSPTHTMIASSFGSPPPENPPPAMSPEPVPDPDRGAPDNPARKPARRRQAGLILAVLAAAAVATVVVVLAFRPHTGNQSPVGDGTATANGAQATASATPAAVPKLALPTVGKTLAVGQDPSFVEVAPSGKFAYVTDVGAKTITVLDTVTDKVSKVIHIPEGPPQFVSFSADGKTAYVSVYATNGSVHLIAFIDTATGEVTGTVPVTNHTPGPSQVSQNGRYLYVPNHNSMTLNGSMKAMSGPGQDDIDVINTASKKLVGTINVVPNPHWIAVGQGGLLYVTNHTSGKITIVNPNTDKVVKVFSVGETPHAIYISPDGSRLAVTSYGGAEVFIVSTATDKVVATIPVGREPLDVEYTPDGRYLCTTNNEDNTVSVIDAATNKVIGTIKTGKQPTSIDFLPSGRQGYVTDQGSGTVEILNFPQ
jgi:serine/threonine-protein kinase